MKLACSRESCKAFSNCLIKMSLRLWAMAHKKNKLVTRAKAAAKVRSFSPDFIVCPCLVRPAAVNDMTLAGGELALVRREVKRQCSDFVGPAQAAHRLSGDKRAPTRI